MTEQQVKAEEKITIHPGPIEGVVIVNGWPQVEWSDMPLTLSFDTIGELKICKEHETNRA